MILDIMSQGLQIAGGVFTSVCVITWLLLRKW